MRTRRLAPFLLAAAFAVAIAGPAHATFPGEPGPIVYPKVKLDEGGDTGGLRIHGPRLKPKAKPLTNDPDDDSPAFSANGRLIAFAGNRDPGATTGTHIYVVKVDGTGLRQLTSGSFFDSAPSFAPDGQRVVFARRAAGRSHIFSVKLDGSGLRPLTKGDGNDYEPVYTPNGRRIVFVSDRDRDAQTDRRDVFAMAPSGADLRVLIDGPYNEEEPDTSPNGRRIAFVSNRQPGINIFLANAAGRVLGQLTHNRRNCTSGSCNRAPAWSPDGRHIAFLAIGRYSRDLEVMRADGEGEKEFDDAGTETEGFGSTIGAPAWGRALP
jgi:Tol biopolymer transport system component